MEQFLSHCLHIHKTMGACFRLWPSFLCHPKVSTGLSLATPMKTVWLHHWSSFSLFVMLASPTLKPNYIVNKPTNHILYPVWSGSGMRKGSHFHVVLKPPLDGT